MGFTLYHFGFHTWAIFALPGLCFGYFIYKRKLPPRVSSIFAPLLGGRIYGPIGKTIDVVAIIGTIFGVATSVGLGTLQINAGLAQLFGLEESGIIQIALIAVVTVMAGISVALGLDKGIKRLSNFNIGLAVMLLAFVLVTGPSLFLLKGMIESVGIYADSPAEPRVLERHVRRLRLAEHLDGVLLGLDHHLVAVRGHLHRTNLTRPDRPRIRRRGAGSAGALLGHLVQHLRYGRVPHRARG